MQWGGHDPATAGGSARSKSAMWRTAMLNRTRANLREVGRVTDAHQGKLCPTYKKT